MTAAVHAADAPSNRPLVSSDVLARFDCATGELRRLRGEISQHDPRISGLASQVSDVTLKISAAHERALADFRASLQDQKRSLENLATHVSRLATQTSKRMNALEEDQRQSCRQLASRLEALEAQDGFEVLSTRMASLELNSCFPLARLEEFEAHMAALDGEMRSKGLLSPVTGGSQGKSSPVRHSAAMEIGYNPSSRGAQSPATSATTPQGTPVAESDRDRAPMHTWSTHQTHILCDADGEATIAGKAPQLDQFVSVAEAVEELNADTDLCPGGFCVVFSARQRRYVLVFRSDKEREAFVSFNLDLEVRPPPAADTSFRSRSDSLATTPVSTGGYAKIVGDAVQAIREERRTAGAQVATGDEDTPQRQESTLHRELRPKRSTEVLFPGTPRMEQAVRMLPTEAAAEEPVYAGRMPPEVTMAALRECLDRDDWFIDKFLCEVMLCRDMNWDLFLSPALTPAVKVRRCTFVMALPQDVPKVVASMIGLPKESRFTIVYRMQILSEELMLVSQAHTHDVMFGDKFRVQDIHVWRQLADGGVEYRKWSSTVWLAALPWTHGVVKSVIDSKTIENAKNNVDAFIRVICSSIQPQQVSFQGRLC